MSQNQQEQSEAKLLAFIEGELDAEGRAEIEKHLEAHPQHRRLLEEMRGMRDWVRWLPKEAAPAELVEGFQGKLERSVLLGPADQPAGRDPMRINRWPQVRAWAAVLALAVGLGAIVYKVLPGRHAPIANVPHAGAPYAINSLTTGPSETAARTDGAVNKGAQAREPSIDAMATQAQTPGSDPGRALAAAPIPATGPAESQTALAKATPAPEGLGGPGTNDDGAARQPAMTAAPTTEPTVAEAAKRVAEPAEELERVARGTYQMVNADPAIIGLLDHPPTAPIVAALRGNQLSLKNDGAEKSLRARNQFVMVVVSSDTDRARKQIGDYLANNGIAAQVVADGDSPAPSNSASIAAREMDENAAPASPPGPPVAKHGEGAGHGSAAGVPGSFGMAPQAAGVAPAASAERSSDAAPAAPRALPAAPQLPFAAATPTAPVPAPADRSNRVPVTAVAPAPVAAARPAMPGGAVGGQIPSTDDDRLLALPKANGDVLIARRMTARQAHDLQATLCRPQAAQWAQVYNEPLHQPYPPGPTEQLGDKSVDKQNGGALQYAANQAQAAQKDAITEALEARKIASQPFDKANPPGKKAAPAGTPTMGSAQTPSTGPGMSPAAGRGTASSPATKQAALRLDHNPAMSPSVERARSMPRAATPAAPVPPAAGAISGGEQSRNGQSANREKAGQDSAMPAPSNAPAAKPAATTALADVAADDQPVDIVIVLQQAPAEPALLTPASTPPAPGSTPGLPATRPGE